MTNLIDHEYIEGLCLFNRRFMQRSFYVSFIRKFGLLNMDYLQFVGLD
jgi:hypothetical protein